MKTKRKAIRRVPSISSLSPLDLSLGVKNMDCQPPPLKRKHLVCDNIAPHPCRGKTNKKICTHQAELPHQHVFRNTSTAAEKNRIVDNTGTSSTITSQCKPFSVTLCLCLISTDIFFFLRYLRLCLSL